MNTVLQPISAAEELLALLDDVTFDDMRRMWFRNTPFLFFHFDELSESDGYAEASYTFSTVTGGYDVYILKGKPRDYEKRMLFHEVYEASLVDGGLTLDQAHQTTLLEEEKAFGPRQQITKSLCT